MSISNGYCTRDEAKSWADITGSTSDSTVDVVVETVSRWIDTHCERRFWKDVTATARTYVAECAYELAVDDLVSVTTVKNDLDANGSFETTWLNTDFQLWPLNPLDGPELRPYRKIVAVGARAFPIFRMAGTRTNLVEVTGIFGWPAVPLVVKQACLIQSARILKRRTSPEGVAGFGEFGVVRISGRLDADVADFLAPYRLLRTFV